MTPKPPAIAPAAIAPALIARVERHGILRFQNLTMRAALGHAGITTRKQEGDGATPAGLLPIRRILYRAERIPRPRTTHPTEPLSPQDGWCDQPSDPAYNRPVHLPYAGHHEDLWRSDHLYDLIATLGWNDSPPIPPRGSAIFLHCAAPDYSPTEGCIAVAVADLATLLAAGIAAVSVSNAF